MENQKQKDRILEYMQKHGSITSLEAFEKIGCTRISARIWDLRSDGYIIASTRESGLNRFGERTNYVRYVLH